MMRQLIDKSKIYLYIFLLLILLSLHNINLISNIDNYFKIDKINIIGKVDKSLSDDVLKSLDKFSYINIFSIKTYEIKSELEKFKLISEYKIKKEYPSVIRIELKQTDILAYYYDNNVKTFIGNNGKKIKHQNILTSGITQIIGEVDIKKFLTLKEILEKNGFRLKDFNKIYSFKSLRWDLMYKNKIIIKLPMEDFDISLNIFKEFINNQTLKEFKIIDLRIKNKIILL